MKGLRYSTVLVAVLGLTVWGCEKATNPTEVPLSDQGGVRSLAKAEAETIKLSDSAPYSLFNDCTGEFVSGVVSLEATINIITDGNGGFHYHFIDIFDGNGVGETSGIQYEGSQTDHESFHGSSNGAVEDTFTLDFRLISRGSADNIMLHILAHVTVTPNGEATSEILTETVKCKG